MRTGKKCTSSRQDNPPFLYCISYAPALISSFTSQKTTTCHSRKKNKNRTETPEICEICHRDTRPKDVLSVLQMLFKQVRILLQIRIVLLDLILCREKDRRNSFLMKHVLILQKANDILKANERFPQV